MNSEKKNYESLFLLTYHSKTNITIFKQKNYIRYSQMKIYSVKMFLLWNKF